MRSFNKEDIAKTNYELQRARPVDVRQIDFKNPYFTQPKGTEIESGADFLSSIDGLSAEHIYVHVPFCAVHCIYCHYPKLTNEHSLENQNAFLDHLEEEINQFKNRLKPEKPRTVHIGGGTPNTLTEQNLERLLSLLTRHFPATEEFAVELYPNDLSREKLDLLAKSGVNRVSIGIQTFDDSVNDQNHRYFQNRLSSGEILNTAAKLFPNVSIDLLYGQRGQDIDTLQKDCEIAHSLGVNSIYLYQTREWLDRKAVDLQVGLCEFLVFFENHGYEIVSFDQVIKARNADGFCCHRSGRSKSENLLGLGPGAVSELGPFIFRNRGPRDYLADGFGIDQRTIIHRSERVLKAEFVNRGLRHFNMPGLNGFYIPEYRGRFGSDPTEDFSAEFDILEDNGLIARAADSIQITDYGMLFSQAINYLLLGHYK